MRTRWRYWTGLVALCVFAAVLALSGPAVAAKRMALVIGNDAYRDVPVLLKAVNDARAVAARLETAGFEVTLATDLGRRALNQRISRFTGGVAPGDVAFLFYAGHGVEIDGENYLLPVDIPDAGPDEQDFVKSEALALSDLLDRLQGAGAGVNIAIIDACRNNPFRRGDGRSVGGTRGLGRIAPPEGMFVIFSAGAGQEALDRLNDADPDPNSVFTRVLLPMLGAPGLSIRDVALRLKTGVNKLAGTVAHKQAPAYYDELIGDFAFSARAMSAGDKYADQPDPARQAYEAAVAARSIAGLDYVVRTWTGGVYAILAEEELAKLRPVNQVKARGDKDGARRSFEAARDAGSRAGLEFVARNYRGSVFAAMAEEHLALLKTGRAAKGGARKPARNAAVGPGDAPVVVAGMRGAPAAKRRAAGAVMIQLGAFMSEDAAMAQWSMLAAEHGDYLQNVRARIDAKTFGGGAQLHRLRAGGMGDAAEAQALCAGLQAQGVDCIVLNGGPDR